MPLDEDRYREFTELVRGRSLQDRRIFAVVYLNRHLPPSRRAVLVGGALVEFLTGGQYTTGDIDLVGVREDVIELLLQVGFEEDGRYLVSEEFDLVLEVPGRELRDSEEVVTRLYSGLEFLTVTTEDAVIDRLCAAKFWQSQTDWEQAYLIARIHLGELDIPKLKEKALENRVEDILAELLEAVSD